MYTLRPTSFFKPSSRPTSPVPVPRQDGPVPAERAARPLSKLSLSTFRRPSPSPATGLTPSTTVIQDGSFMEVLGLKLSEAVSKALAQPSGAGAPGEMLGGRRPIPPGRGRTLGALIVSEVNASRENPHLYRAVIRTLQRPLSVLLTNISTNLIPLLSSTAFHTPAAPTPQEPQPNATQLHAVALATFAGELLEAFDEIGLGVEVDTRGDNLRGIREGLVSIVKRVVEPLINGMKNELMPIIDALETVPPPPPTSTNGVVGKTSATAKAQVHHPAITTLQTLIPIYSRALSRYVASAYAESALASFVISVVWRGLVALAHRPAPPSTPPASPSMHTTALKPKEVTKKSSSSTTPPATPPASRFTLKLPPSRPPTPPSPGLRGPTVAADARMLFNLLSQLPKPSQDKPQTRLARDVVDEAFEGLSAFIALLESIQPPTAPVRTAASPAPGASPKALPLTELEADLELLTADLPIVISLPVLLRTYLPGAPERTVHALLGLSEAEYRKGCLGGFGRAEECGIAVGQRVLDVLRADPAVRAGGAEGAVLLRWLERELEAARAERARADGEAGQH
ncbi:hypothetical protein GY45DRAFT_1301868 [Cubamyces sp. BRFM 1775]|nr:hypothetical protein GY45DRAFT_1301868 [Cubamyces sp. BRFM 1775]